MSRAKVLTQWNQFGKFPFGRWLFSKMMGVTVPYAASIDARVETLSEGRALLRLDDRRAVRNHLKSIHAAALAHLAEMTANLALMTRQPSSGRWIVTGTETSLLKKARGPIRAETEIPMIDWSTPQDLIATITLRDARNDIVMTATQRWKIGTQAN